MQLANLHGRAKVTPSSKSWAAMFECLMYHNASKSFVSNSSRQEKTIHCSLVEAYNSNAKGLQSAHQLEPSYTFHAFTLTARVARLKWLVPMHQAVPSTTGSSRRNNSVLQTFVQYFLQVLSMQTSAPQKLFFFLEPTHKRPSHIAFCRARYILNCNNPITEESAGQGTKLD